MRKFFRAKISTNKVFPASEQKKISDGDEFANRDDKKLKIEKVENGDSDRDSDSDGDGGKEKESIAAIAWRWLTASPEEVTGELMMKNFI